MDNQQTQTLRPKTDYTTASEPPSAAEQSSSEKVGTSVDSGGEKGSEENQSFLDKGM